MIRSDLHCAQHSEILVLNYADCPSFLTLDAARISPKSIQYQVIFVQTTPATLHPERIVVVHIPLKRACVCVCIMYISFCDENYQKKRKIMAGRLAPSDSCMFFGLKPKQEYDFFCRCLQIHLLTLQSSFYFTKLESLETLQIFRFEKW